MRTSVFFQVSVFALSGSFSVVAAQAATLSGTVHVFGDSVHVLPGVDLELTPSGRRVRSDSLGHFRITGLVAGDHSLRARLPGFDSLTMSVRVPRDAETSVIVAMRPTATVLKTVTINGRPVTYPARYADAYWRAARSNGRFFDRELIEKLQPLDIRSLLQTVPGVHVTDRLITFQRCNGNLGIPSSIIVNRPQRDAPPESDVSTNTAHVQVYVDGTRLTRYSASPVFNVDAEHALRDINPASIQMMEVYTGVARIPGEYLDDACAVILIWTR